MITSRMMSELEDMGATSVIVRSLLLQLFREETKAFGNDLAEHDAYITNMFSEYNRYRSDNLLYYDMLEQHPIIIQTLYCLKCRILGSNALDESYVLRSVELDQDAFERHKDDVTLDHVIYSVFQSVQSSKKYGDSVSRLWHMYTILLAHITDIAEVHRSYAKKLLDTTIEVADNYMCVFLDANPLVREATKDEPAKLSFRSFVERNPDQIINILL